MKNLRKLIFGTGIFLSSILPSFGQNIINSTGNTETKPQEEKYVKDFFKIGAGNHIWDDEDLSSAYGTMFMIKPEYSRALNEIFSLNVSLDLFLSKKEKINITTYTLSNFAANIGIENNIISSKDGSTFIHASLGLQYMSISEKVETDGYTTYNTAGSPIGYVDPTNQKEKGSGVGAYAGAGIEVKVTDGLFFFGDVNLTWNSAPLYGNKLNTGGTELSVGLEFY